MSTPSSEARQVAHSAGPVKTRRVNVGGKPFSARNPMPIGAIGLVLVVVLLWAAFNASKLPLIGGGTSYSAYFSEAAGLRANDDVRVAGVKVGTVDGVSLAGDKVKVTFKVKNTFVGDQSTLAINLKTLLGAKFLSIDSVGTNGQRPGDTIPLSRTHAPFDVYPAFTELTNTVDNIDTTKLAQAFTQISSAFQNTPGSVKTVIQGMTRLSQTISSRDAELRNLLTQANAVTGVLASRDQQLQQLLTDGGLLLDELNARRDQIHQLLISTTELSLQLQGLVSDNQHTIAPLLNQLDQLLNLLQRNQDNLDRGLALLGPFYRVFNNTVGNGHWFDNYIQNLNGAGILGLLGIGNV